MGRDAGQVDAPAGAVEERDAVQQETGREGPEQEILERPLDGVDAVAREPGQDVQRDREDLQAEEDGQEVLAGRHHRHPRDRELDQGEELAVPVPFGAQMDGRREHGEQGGGDEDQVEGQGPGVDQDRRLEELLAVAAHEKRPRRHPGQKQEEGGVDGGPAEVAIQPQGDHHQDEDASHGRQEHRHQAGEIVEGHRSTKTRTMIVPKKKMKA